MPVDAERSQGHRATRTERGSRDHEPDVVLELSSSGQIDGWIDPWRKLAATVGASYFQLPEWVLAWWEMLADSPKTRVAIWTNEVGEAEALAVLSRVAPRLHPRLPLKVATTIIGGSGPGGADHLGFPSLPHRRDHVRTWIETEAKGSLSLTNVDPDSCDLVPARANNTGSQRCPRVDIESGLPVGISGNARRQLRSRLRKAEAAGLTFRFIPPGELSNQHLETLLDLHGRRWDMKEAPSSFTRARIPFHARLVETAAQGRGPAAVVAMAPSGDTVGMVYGFVWQDTFAFFQSGWHPDWAEVSLGTVLHGHAMAFLSSEGIRTYDFLRGAEEYKYRFGASDRSDESFLVPVGVGGLALRAKARWKNGTR